jgi:uncharacterized protein (TIRG00374 family)
MRAIWSRIAVGLALGLVVLVGGAVLADVRLVGRELAEFHWPSLLAALGLTLVNYTLRFLKWHYYIRLIGANRIRWRQSLRVFVGGLPLALSPGKLAEPLKAVWLYHYSGVAVARGIPVVAAERISDGLALLMLTTLGIGAYPQYWLGFVAVLAILLAMIGASQWPMTGRWLQAASERVPLLRRWFLTVSEFSQSARQLFGPRSILVAVGLGVVAWLAEGLALYWLLLGLGLPPGMPAAATAIFVLSCSMIVGAVSSLPGGLGAAEASLAGLLTLTLNVPEATAASATLLIRFLTLWLGVAIGVVTLLTAPDLVRLRADANLERAAPVSP